MAFAWACARRDPPRAKALLAGGTRNEEWDGEVIPNTFVVEMLTRALQKA